MKSNKYRVKVTDENNKTENSIQDSCNSPRKRKLVFSYLAFLVLCVLMGISFFVKCSTNKDEYKNDSSYELSVDAVELKTNNAVLKKTDNIIPIICMTIFCTVGVFFVCFVLIKDDSGIRFAKLNELRNLRKDISLNFSDKEKVENIKEVETELVQFPQPKDLCQTNSANVNINYNLPAIKSEKEKSLYAEFLKNYMNAIVEI